MRYRFAVAMCEDHEWRLVTRVGAAEAAGQTEIIPNSFGKFSLLKLIWKKHLLILTKQTKQMRILLLLWPTIKKIMKSDPTVLQWLKNLSTSNDLFYAIFEKTKNWNVTNVLKFFRAFTFLMTKSSQLHSHCYGYTFAWSGSRLEMRQGFQSRLPARAVELLSKCWRKLG